MSQTVGQQVENAVVGVVDEYMRQLFNREERLKLENERFLELHEKTVSTLESQLEDTLKNSSLSIEKDGIKYDFDSIKDGQLLFKNEDKIISVPPHEIEKTIGLVKTNIEEQNHEKDNVNEPLKEEIKLENKEPLAEKIINLSELEKDLSETLKKSPYIVENDGEKYDFKGIENGNLVFQNGDKAISIPPNEIESKLKLEKEPSIEGILDKNGQNIMSLHELKGKLEAINYLKDMSRDDVLNLVRDTVKESKEQKVPIFELYKDKLEKNIKEYIDHTKEKFKEKFVDRFKVVGEKINEFKTDISQKMNLLFNPQEKTKVENSKEIEKQLVDTFKKIPLVVEKDGVKYEFESIVKTDLVFKNGEKSTSIPIPEMGSILKLEKDISREQQPKETSKDKEIKLEKSVETPKEKGINVKEQIEIINQLKNLKPQEVTKIIEQSTKEAKEKNIPVAETIKGKLENTVRDHITKSRDKFLNKAVGVHEKIMDIKKDLRSIEKDINSKLGELERARLKDKVTPEQYAAIKEKLEDKKEQIQERTEKLGQSEKKIENQMKVTLQAQYPTMNTDRLSLVETLAIASVASSVSNKTVENLKEFTKDHGLNDVMKTIDKATQRIETVIEKTFEMSR
ncbi:hypothetical protein U0X36_25855 [Bacillus thuringiensis]|uniref:coiled-coil domain-containing protein n=1 Tax=Bacillus thuringiensis TaxID=1428 RepID=UPI000E4F892D|nr:hypothetical protein [Bacillus thuringiensis]MDZ3956239.1 hypothetical protein [Bacillus thuringiensis]RGP43347.1 hypothetical protein BTW32_29955 [Bacillus thuringiensis]